MVVMPTLVITARKGFPSEDVFLPGSSFSNELFPYDRQTGRDELSDGRSQRRQLES